MVTAQSAYNRHLWLPLFLLAAFLYMTAAFAEAREWELFVVGLLFILCLLFVFNRSEPSFSRMRSESFM